MPIRNWFVDLAETIGEIVELHGGAYVTSLEGLKTAVIDTNPTLSTTDAQWNHMLAPLNRRAGLITCAYQGTDGSVVVIFDPVVHRTAAAARAHCEEYGLPEDVEIALMERRKVSA